MRKLLRKTRDRKVSIFFLGKFFLPLFFGMFLSPSLSFSDVFQERLPPTGEPGLNLWSESLEPGGILLVSWAQTPALSRVEVGFGGKALVVLPPDNPGGCFCLIGIDLSLEPGKYVLEGMIVTVDGKEISFQKKLSVKPKFFGTKHIRVERKYVTPPASAQERIRKEAELLKTIYSVFTPRWQGTGNFLLPCAGTVYPNFGERRILNGIPRSPHSGVDIDAREGDPVVASNAGRVSLAGDLYYSGYTVLLDHGLGVFTVYCHLSSLSVRTGETVRKGQTIGQVGSTGRATGPHLHWSARVSGSRVNPLALLSLPLE